MQNPVKRHSGSGLRRAWLQGLLVPACALAVGCTGKISTSGSAARPPGGGGGGAGSGGGGPTVSPNPPPDSNGWYEALTAANCASGPAALPQSRVWRLSARQWKNTVEQAFKITGLDVSGFPKDEIDPRTGFTEDATDNKVTLGLAGSYYDGGDAIGAKAAPGMIQAFPCLATAPIAVSCGQMAVADYGRRLFRRPLTPAETTTYATFLANESKIETTDPAATAVRSLVRVMLLSPDFLYRTELGNSVPGKVALSGYEIASLLSFSIADVPPDEALLQQAASGQLAKPEVREAEARRLLLLPGARERLGDFWRQYLSLSEFTPTADIDAATGAAIVQETTGFFDHVVWDSPGGFRDLLTAKYTYADPKVAALYGSMVPGADGKLSLTPAERSGFLTQASFLVRTVAPSQAATVIHRGVLVRERLLCQEPPPPPPGFVPNPAQIQTAGPDATAKENYDVFAMANPTCNACHQTFQPLGISFESYDATARFRTKYPTSGKAILTSGMLTNAGDASGNYADVVEMASKIGDSKIGQYCFSKQYAQYAFGRTISVEQEPCMIRSMGDHVAQNGGAVRELLTSLAHVDAAYTRIHQ
jgi:Protein of unknown function (DUF1592)/Protein of unknown function (DUF1588)/Protein of unknown function (DUF1595)/Protein of unknown function (DUF1587)